ncbi:MAG: DNA-directed RNA polymerase subunit beta' [bacterium]|nr:DNA-directed RNA polymerase subunit beta' [bacterium]
MTEPQLHAANRRLLFDEVQISLASSDQIRAWSYGEVKKPETINHRTLKPERDGLFDERIFGPQRDWECYCGKYKRVRYKSLICEKCGVEVTRSKVRRERMGHIDLAAPVAHIWFFKGVPSRLGYLLDISLRDLEKIIYFAAHVVTSVDRTRLLRDLPELEKEYLEEVREVQEDFEKWQRSRLEELERELARMEEANAKPAEIRQADKAAQTQIAERRRRMEDECEMATEAYETVRRLQVKDLVEYEQLWKVMEINYGDYFTGGMGAEAIRDLLAGLDLDEEMRRLSEDMEAKSAQRRQRATLRMKVVRPFAEGLNDPTNMVLHTLPVIPPDLRPMVQLDGGRFATSDLNDLYRRVINRNNRLKRLLEYGAPEIIVNNERRMLQEAVDALFDNGRRGRAVTGQGTRALKSLSDMIKGKAGRFRQNLLGKRVDYSGRSVIVVGPQLKLHQCGLPKEMALELFKPYVMKGLVDGDLAPNIKSAKRMVEQQRDEVWDVLSMAISEHPVLLNRAPTLHRLGIQAFEPVLVEGKAIQIHPLVCEAFNADFDGDQMAVHLPISPEAQAEARILMLSRNNVLSPASGRPIVTPSQDMVIGIYYLTELEPESRGAGRVFGSVDEAIMAHEIGELNLHAPISVRLGALVGDPELHAELKDELEGLITSEPADGGGLTETTVGRAIFNQAFPDSFPYVNAPVIKSGIRKLVEVAIDRHPRFEVERTLDSLKELGFRYATAAGLTIGLEDVKTPRRKKSILDRHARKAEKVQSLYERGVITDSERRAELIEIWSEATEEVKDAMETTLKSEPFNPLEMMVGSGARGNTMQVRQIAGMRGLVANPRGDIIPSPITSNFREGLSVLEYFISTHGARKGLADTALRTRDAGYLTRKLVDVSQEVMVRETDCGTDRGVWFDVVEPVEQRRSSVSGSATLHDQPVAPVRYLRSHIFGRVLAAPVKIKRTVLTTDRGVRLEEGVLIDAEVLGAIVNRAAEVKRVRVRSVLTCDTRASVCQGCYGMSLATGKMVEEGAAVGIMAAQSIGEPGTQLTMRTFHTGGVAGSDITQGLPRVLELFEARSPKGKAVLAPISGTVEIVAEEGRRIRLTGKDEFGKPSEIEIPLSRHSRVRVANDSSVQAGDPLTDGPLDPKEVLEYRGVRDAQQYLVTEVQGVYQSQGVEIHDKHIELVVRQMLRRVRIVKTNDSRFLPAELVDGQVFGDENRQLLEEGKAPATGRPELMGITKASLATDSWLSAASFQETARVLTDAAIFAKSDYMKGLKENVIIGKLVPAGTGAVQYRDHEPLVVGYERPAVPDPLEFATSMTPSELGGSFNPADDLARGLGVSEELLSTVFPGAGLQGSTPANGSSASDDEARPSAEAEKE